MRICVVTPVFSIAGVPLAQLRFARSLAARKNIVDLVIGRIDPNYTFPELSDVNVLHLGQPNVRGMLLPLIRYLRLSKPDIVFSAEDHLNAIVLLAAILSGSSAKISGSSRVTPFDTYSDFLFSKRWVLKQIVRAISWRADALTCVSHDMVHQYRTIFNTCSHVCVYNIVDDKFSRLRMEEPVGEDWLVRKTVPVVIAAGRLAPWKGFSDLIYAVRELSLRRPIRLLILGDGPLRAELSALIIELGLQDMVKLLGYVDNPLRYFKRADVFALSSYVEGLPNVLVEAMMCGLTPVSTDCPTGPREVLQDGKFGYLVPVSNPTALAAGIEMALKHPISKCLLDQAIRPFEESEVIRKHFEVLGLPHTSGSQLENRT